MHAGSRVNYGATYGTGLIVDTVCRIAGSMEAGSVNNSSRYYGTAFVTSNGDRTVLATGSRGFLSSGLGMIALRKVAGDATVSAVSAGDLNVACRDNRTLVAVKRSVHFGDNVIVGFLACLKLPDKVTAVHTARILLYVKHSLFSSLKSVLVCGILGIYDYTVIAGRAPRC